MTTKRQPTIFKCLISKYTSGKYEEGGLDALQDRRGRKKAEEELTEADKQKLAMKKLEFENERLRAENALLKKLQEFQRR